MTDRKRTIEVDFLVDDKDKRKLKGIGDEAQGTVGKFDSMKGAIGGAIAVIGVQQVVDFAVEIGKLAEQAQIAADSAEKVLGPALEGLHEDLEQTRLTMGYNTAELDTLIAQLGLMTDSLGLTDEAQADFIEWLITTGGELAAFKGDLSLSDEAVAALGATLRGEYDSLEQFGIKVGDAAVEERKLQLAADPANSSLSDQQLELLALQQLITEKAAPAIGSLAEAQDGLAGQTNEATAKFEDLKTQLGTQLLPVLTDLTSFLVEAMDSWDRLANPQTFETTQLAAWLRSLEEFVEDAWAPVQALIDSFDALGDLVGDVLGGIADVNRAQAGINPSPTSPTPRRARQAGGPVSMGNSYLVGERGPETFIPASNGRIAPTGAMINNITIHAGMGSDPNSISRAVVEALQRYQRANGPLPIKTRP